MSLKRAREEVSLRPQLVAVEDRERRHVRGPEQLHLVVADNDDDVGPQLLGLGAQPRQRGLRLASLTHEVRRMRLGLVACSIACLELGERDLPAAGVHEQGRVAIHLPERRPYVAVHQHHEAVRHRHAGDQLTHVRATSSIVGGGTRHLQSRIADRPHRAGRWGRRRTALTIMTVKSTAEQAERSSPTWR
jgi:hypothetical protein